MTDGDALNCMVKVEMKRLWMGLSYRLEAELVGFNDQFGAGGVEEKIMSGSCLVLFWKQYEAAKRL